jgi:hypothetical protein
MFRSWDLWFSNGFSAGYPLSFNQFQATFDLHCSGQIQSIVLSLFSFPLKDQDHDILAVMSMGSQSTKQLTDSARESQRSQVFDQRPDFDLGSKLLAFSPSF